jgi:hypothetical protein
VGNWQILRRMSNNQPESCCTARRLATAAPAGGRGALSGRKELGVSVASGGGHCQGGDVKMPFIFLIRR